MEFSTCTRKFYSLFGNSIKYTILLYYREILPVVMRKVVDCQVEELAMEGLYGLLAVSWGSVKV